MSNDTSTLSGALLEMKDQLISELADKGVTASYDPSTGLLGLIGRISDIQTGGSCYHIEFSEASYVAVGGSATLEIMLQENYAPKSGATVTVTGSDSSLYTGITNSSGIASVTVNNISSQTTFTATYSNVSTQCTVTVSSYIFYDDCTSESTLSHYGTYISIRDSGTSAMTQNGTKHKLTITHQGQSFIPITDLNGIRDSFKLTITSQSTSANTVYCGIGLCLYIDDNNWYSVEDTSSALWTYKKVNGTFTYNQGSRTAQYEGVKLIQEFIYDASTNKVTLNRYDSNMNLIQSKNQSVPSTLTSTIKWGFGTDWAKDSYVLLEEVKAEYL